MTFRAFTFPIQFSLPCACPAVYPIPPYAFSEDRALFGCSAPTIGFCVQRQHIGLLYFGDEAVSLASSSSLASGLYTSRPGAPLKSLLLILLTGLLSSSLFPALTKVTSWWALWMGPSTSGTWKQASWKPTYPACIGEPGLCKPVADCPYRRAPMPPRLPSQPFRSLS